MAPHSSYINQQTAIVCHAPTYQALAFVMEGLDIESVQESKVGILGQGGITRFSRDYDACTSTISSCTSCIS